MYDSLQESQTVSKIGVDNTLRFELSRKELIIKRRKSKLLVPNPFLLEIFLLFVVL